jgi:EAL domain-containing protein (putative c-di-GMP-specific phosphodiesterase class I)
LEALVRWRHPRRGVIPPEQFVAIAEKNGLIFGLSDWVLRAACRQMSRWIAGGIAPPLMAVNISAVQFRQPVLLERSVVAALDDAKLAADRLELELTEGVLMDSPREHEEVLVRLRQRGIRIAIDDFGTGYSSLEYLARLPIDRIKIAQSFLSELKKHAASATVVKAAIRLGLDLGLRVIVEGVETADQLAMIRAWGCGEVQGYYFSKPLSTDNASIFLRRHQTDLALRGKPQHLATG